MSQSHPTRPSERRERSGKIRAQHIAHSGPPSAQLKGLLSLTDTELQLLLQACHGLNDKQIAADTGRSNKTVRFHIRNAMRKTGVRTRLELGFYASQIIRQLAEQLVMTGDVSQLRSMLTVAAGEGASSRREQVAIARPTRGGR